MLISTSIEYSWEDDLAIKGAALPGDYTPKLRLWRNSEHKERLKIFRRYERDGSILEVRMPRCVVPSQMAMAQDTDPAIKCAI